VSSILRWLGRATAVLAAAGSCSGPAAEPSLENEPSRTHVVVNVERQSLDGHHGSDDFSVLLSVLKIPQSLRGDRLLRLMGLRSDLPVLGTCEVVELANRASPSLSSVERIELLDVGDVSVTSGKQTVRLARQAFPTVTDFISGVVYANRDKTPDLTSPNSGFVLRARGAIRLKAFTVEVADLPPLDHVLVDDAPLSEVPRLDGDSSFELRWNRGAPGDVLWVEFACTTGHKVVSCAFDDALGNAKVPGGLNNERGEAHLTLHRLHQVPVDVSGFDHAEVRFDSRVTHTLTLH
jgi:hypothetical protein